MKIVLAGPTEVNLLKDLTGQSAPVDVHSFPLTAHLARAYSEAGHEVRIVVQSFDVAAPLPPYGDKISVAIVPRRKAKASIRDWFGYEVKTIREAINSFAPDVVHAHWTYEYARGALSSSAPALVTAHDVPVRLMPLMRPRYYWWPKLLQGFYVSRKAPLMTGQSPYTVEEWRTRMHRRLPMELVPNAVPTPNQDALIQRPVLDRQSPKFACVSNGFSGRKNVANLVLGFAELLKEVPGARLLLFGKEMEHGGEAMRFAQSLHLDQSIDCWGIVPNSQLMEALRSCDILVHPSLEESFGMVVAEAMSMAIPVVGGESAGAIPWLLDDGRAGILCDVTRPGAICKAMLDSLESGRRYLEPGLERIRSHFSLEVVSSQYLKLLDQIGNTSAQ